VQPEEARQLVQAWNRLEPLVAIKPSLGKVKPGLEVLTDALG
jgi:hypothetical protein